MKNHVLDDLTERAERARDALPVVLLRWDDEFVNEAGVVVPMAIVMQKIGKARELVTGLHQALAEEPRRASPKKGDG